VSGVGKGKNIEVVWVFEESELGATVEGRGRQRHTRSGPTCGLVTPVRKLSHAGNLEPRHLRSNAVSETENGSEAFLSLHGNL
jgi:hypothetical protein